MLNDEIKLTTGLIETSYAEKPENDVEEYSSITEQEKKIYRMVNPDISEDELAKKTVEI